MKIYVSDGHVVQYTAPADHTAGVGYVMTAWFVVAMATVSSGSQGAGVCDGVVELPKGTTVDFALGEKVFWDDTNKLCKESSTGYFEIGVAVKAAGNPSSTVQVRLNGKGVTAV